MSHATDVAMDILDLQALAMGCRKAGVQFARGQDKWEWYGRVVGKQMPLLKGMTREDIGKCSHAIKVPDTEYEIGVVEIPPGNYREVTLENGKTVQVERKGYTLMFDSWGPGEKIVEGLGEGLEQLKVAYSEALARKTALAEGRTVERVQLPNGEIELRMTRA